jgi:hypothetical protein
MKAKRLEAGVRIDETWCAHRQSTLYARQGSQCDDTFPKKKIHFYFNHPCDPVAGLRSLKGRKFKIF